MNTGFTKRALALILAVCMLLSTVTLTTVAAGNEWKPATDGTTKIYVLTDNLTAEKIDILKYEANFFKAEYAAKGLGTINVTFGSAEYIGDKDIVLTFDSTVAHSQGYKITVNGGQLIVAASGDDGIYYGWHEVIKQLKINGKVVSTSDSPDVDERAISLDNGRKYYSVAWIKQLIREMSWANMNTLVLHFSEEMGLGLESKEFSWLNGRDGDLCTEAAVSTDNTVLTQSELREIAAYAKAYHVELIPSLDSPGHLNYLVKKFNEKVKKEGSFEFVFQNKTYKATYVNGGYQFYVDGVRCTDLPKASIYGIGNYLLKSDGSHQIVQGTRNRSYSRGIDITNPVAVAFVQKLTLEYANLFRELGSTKIDIGGDELLGYGDAFSAGAAPRLKWQYLAHWEAYAEKRTNNTNATSYDAFLLYMNDMNTLVRSVGYTGVRMWNDDALRQDVSWNRVVTLDSNIDIWYWSSGTNTCWAYANEGHGLYNVLSDYTYYVLTNNYLNSARGNRSDFKKAYADLIYNEWSPYRFDPNNGTLGTGNNMAVGNKNALGGAFAIWSDNPTHRDEGKVMSEIKPMFRAIAAKSWDATVNSRVNYNTHTSNWSKIGDSSNINLSTITSNVPDPTALRAAVEDFNTVNPDYYSAESFATYKAAVDAGITLLKKGGTQTQLNNAKANIVSAKGALITFASVLETAVEESESVTEGTYSAASYAAYVKAVNVGRAVLAKQNPTAKEITDAYNAIMAAKAALTVDKSELEAAVAEGELTDPVDFSANTYRAYADAVAAGKALLADPNATQTAVDAATAAILAAKANLTVDISVLVALVTESYGFNGERYSVESRVAYLNAISAANEIIGKENPTQEEILNVYNAIRAAKIGLTVNKTVLQNALNDAPSLDSVDTSAFSEDVLNRYENAIANAQAVIADSTVTQVEIDAAWGELLIAKGAIFGVDYSELEAWTNKLESMAEQKKNAIYPANYHDCMFLVNEARAYYLDVNHPDQNAVNIMTETIMTHYAMLNDGTYDTFDKTQRVDYVATLRYLIERYKTFSKNHAIDPYMTEVWLVYYDLIAAAQNLLDSNMYDRDSVLSYVVDISIREMFLMDSTFLEKNHAPKRQEIINSAGFQTKSAYRGRAVRLAVNTDCAFDVTAVVVVDENGLVVPVKITVAPVNNRKPDQKILYVDITMSMERGDHTYTVYVIDGVGQEKLLCSDPVQCTITVK